MIPTRIEGALPRPIGAPADWNPDQQGHCAALFVRPEQVRGMTWLRSAWEASPSEALALLAGGRISLGVCTVAHPVVNLDVELPPEGRNIAMSIRFLNDNTGAPYIRIEASYPDPAPRSFYVEVRPQAKDLTNAQAIAIGIDMIETMAREAGVIE